MSHDHCTDREAEHWNEGYTAGRLDVKDVDHDAARDLCGHDGHLFACVGCGEMAPETTTSGESSVNQLWPQADTPAT